MIQRPPDIGKFQFVILSTLRAAQLMRGCRPKFDSTHKATITAQMEVSEGSVAQVFGEPDRPNGTAAIDDTPIELVAAIVERA